MICKDALWIIRNFVQHFLIKSIKTTKSKNKNRSIRRQFEIGKCTQYEVLIMQRLPQILNSRMLLETLKICWHVFTELFSSLFLKHSDKRIHLIYQFYREKTVSCDDHLIWFDRINHTSQTGSGKRVENVFTSHILYTLCD